ncbi:MAG: hypothetical protein JJU02_07540 [Cryomorphaceae bacterium]|nr:hypothetical protein [Cryomorphaceae bacterium]
MNQQNTLIAAISKQLPQNLSLADALGDTLNISKDAAYRRIRGETLISFDEACELSKRFNISLNDVIVEQQDRIVFQRDTFITSLEDLKKLLLQNLETFTNINKATDKKVYYLAKDIPLFHPFGFPKLGAFRMYVWLKSVYHIEKIDDKNYSISDIPKEFIEIAARVNQEYERIPAVEFWNDTTIMGLLMQIEYYYEAGLFTNKSEALEVLEEFRLMIRRIYKNALNGHRTKEDGTPLKNATYEMYINEILIMDNHILSEVKGNLRYYLPYGGVNYLMSTDQKLCSDMKAYIDKQSSKSSLISQVSEKERNRFFIKMGRKIELLKEKVESTNPFF